MTEKTAESKFLNENLDFLGHSSTCKAENIHKIHLLRPKKMLIYFLDNFQITLKSNFTRKYALPTATHQIKVTVRRGVKIIMIKNQGEESHSNQGHPQGAC